MLIAFHGIDRSDAPDLRASLRPAHLAFHAERNNLVGGPLRDSDGDMCGSLIIFDAADIADAADQMSTDPYITGELFETVTIREFTAADWPTDA